jgi:hypothetical protein
MKYSEFETQCKANKANTTFVGTIQSVKGDDCVLQVGKKQVTCPIRLVVMDVCINKAGTIVNPICIQSWDGFTKE